MQHLITKQGDLLNEYGELNQAGWAKNLILSYHRAHIKASKFRIKEWDYYCILSENKGIAFTIADNSYLGFVAVTVFDFDKAVEYSNSLILPFTMGKLNMPESSKQGNVIFKNKNVTLEFIREKEARILKVYYPNFYKNKDLKGSITLKQPDGMETMVIASNSF